MMLLLEKSHLRALKLLLIFFFKIKKKLFDILQTIIVLSTHVFVIALLHSKLKLIALLQNRRNIGLILQKRKKISVLVFN